MTRDAGDIARIAEIDKLLSRGNIHRMRGDILEAEDSFRQALAVDESRDDIRELIADMLYARGQLDKAAQDYRSLMEKRPGNVPIETKYAKVVLEIGERNFERQMAEGLIMNPSRFSERPQRPVASMLLSITAPGAGQLYNGEILKGMILLGVFFLSIVALALSPTDCKNMLLYLGAMINPHEGILPPVSGIALLFTVLLVIDWIYAMIDAPISADKLRNRPGQSAESK